MYAWYKGAGKAFRQPLKGSTNYLSAYDKQGNLVRAGGKDGRKGRQRDQDVEPETDAKIVEEEEADAARRDQEDESLSDEDRSIRREQRELARNTRTSNMADSEARGGVPKERPQDMRPYPLNQSFRSQPVLSEELREQLYVQVAIYRHDLSSVAASFGVDIRRVAAVVRLKTVEKQWEAEVSRAARMRLVRNAHRCRDDSNSKFD